MTDLIDLSSRIKALAETCDRIIVAIVGAPGSGKSTLVANLAATLNNAVVVPMDGFHLDNVILEERGLLSRKGSPETFDADGYHQFISRLKHSTEAVYAPVFDRGADLSRAGAIEISSDVKLILTEGNYLLLQQSPWNKLNELFDLTAFLDVPETELRERLVNRWLAHGLSFEAAVKRAEDNDLRNANLVQQHSQQADVTISTF